MSPFQKKNSQEFQMMAVSKELLRAVADHRGLKELKIGGPALASFQHGEQFSSKLSFSFVFSSLCLLLYFDHIWQEHGLREKKIFHGGDLF